MAAKKKKHRKEHRKKRSLVVPPLETRASEAITVAWTVTITMTLLCDLVIIAAHFYLTTYPEATQIELLRGLMLLGGSLVGIMSLIILPILYRVRKFPPPRGLVIFGICVAIAPLAAILARTFG